MHLAILFWFYKEPEVCINRLQLLKKYNSDIKIFGLFGGNQLEANLFKEKLGKYLDDFYVSPYKSKDYKWYHGDLVLLDWFKKRGRLLQWDSIVEIQWDTMVFASLKNIFDGVKTNEIFLSGLRILNKTVENKWDWTDPKLKQSENYRKFLAYIKTKYKYKDKPLCWLAILAVFPRIFFEIYQTVENKHIGFLEYNIPTYAKIFSIPFAKKDLAVEWDLGVEWFGKGNYPLNAIPREIQKKYITRQLNKPGGWRIFHPYYKIWAS